MTDEIKKQGTLANIGGNVLERTVKEVFLSKGFELVNYRDWQKKPDTHGKELLLTNAPFTTIYKHKGNTEFLAVSEKYNFKIRIECKWQQVAGSVDEKLPYLYLNCIEAMPEDYIIIVIDGGGFKEGAVKWLRETAKQNKYNKADIGKKILVFTLAEFMAWANKSLR
jgi:hypothetical protein